MGWVSSFIRMVKSMSVTLSMAGPAATAPNTLAMAKSNILEVGKMASLMGLGFINSPIKVWDFAMRALLWAGLETAPGPCIMMGRVSILECGLGARGAGRVSCGIKLAGSMKGPGLGTSGKAKASFGVVMGNWLGMGSGLQIKKST